MFRVGSRVVVVASNHDGNSKKTSPKIGSYGYVSSVGNFYIDRDIDVFAQPITVVFNRYGYEKRDNRCEVKNVISLIYVPSMVPKERLKQEQVLERLDEFMLSMPKIDPENGRWMNIRMELDGSADIVILAETISMPVSLVADKKEFSAWLYAVTMSDQVRHQLHKIDMGHQGTLRNHPEYAGYFSALKNIAFHNGDWEQTLHELSLSEESRRKTKDAVLFVTTTEECRNRPMNFHQIQQGLGAARARPSQDARRFYGGVLRHLWNEPMFLEAERVLLSKGSGDAERGVQKVRWVKDYLGFLAPESLVGK